MKSCGTNMPILETLRDCIERNETYFANELAIVFADQRITFGQLGRRARRLAAVWASWLDWPGCRE